jgi:hypothetical protein
MSNKITKAELLTSAPILAKPCWLMCFLGLFFKTIKFINMSNWYTKIDISFRNELKGYGNSYHEIEKGCELVLKTLGKLYNKIPSWVHTEYNGVYSEQNYNKNYLWYNTIEKVEELKDHFDFCKSFANNEIKKEEWDEYDFDGDLLGMFNGYLSEFYDLCDSYVTKNQKFCWVSL